MSQSPGIFLVREDGSKELLSCAASSELQGTVEDRFRKPHGLPIHACHASYASGGEEWHCWTAGGPVPRAPDRTWSDFEAIVMAEARRPLLRVRVDGSQHVYHLWLQFGSAEEALLSIQVEDILSS